MRSVSGEYARSPVRGSMGKTRSIESGLFGRRGHAASDTTLSRKGSAMSSSSIGRFSCCFYCTNLGYSLLGIITIMRSIIYNKNKKYFQFKSYINNHKSENYLGMVQTIWLTNQEFIDFYHGKIQIESGKKGSLETYKELVSLWK